MFEDTTLSATNLICPEEFANPIPDFFDSDYHYPEEAAKANSYNAPPDWDDVDRALAQENAKHKHKKVSKDVIEDNEAVALIKGTAGCGSRYLVGVTGSAFDQGAHYFKRMYCGREWCPVCSQNGSIAHRRKMGRWYPKWFSIEKGWCYLVLTIPEDMRQYIGKEELRYLTNYVKRKIKRDFDQAKGFIRWHFGGDIDQGSTYKPHLNVVFDHCFIPRSYLDELKEGWKNALMACLGGLEVKVGNVYTRYIPVSDPAAIPRAIHLLRYITRATYYGKDLRIREIISKYRNNITFGWTKENIRNVDAQHEGLTALTKVNWKTGIKITQREFETYRSEFKLRYIGLGLWTDKKEPPEIQKIE